MIEPIWQAAEPLIDGGRMQRDIKEFYALSRLCSYDAILSLARLIADKMRESRMEDVRLIDFPADGRTFYGGWAMPRAYDVHSAHLNDVSNATPGETLADYRANPISLLLYSLPTPPEGVTAELVVADTPDEITRERAEGRLVLTSGIGVAYGLAAMRAGAAGLVSDCRQGPKFIKDGDYLDTTTEWHNYTIPPWDLPNKGFGFSITPEDGQRLRQRIDREGVRLHAFVDTRHYDGVLPVISARLPGRTEEEIVLTGHYDEFGADDNCSQVAVALQAIRAIRWMAEYGDIPPLERSVRVLLPMEVRGFNALIQQDEEIRHIRAGLNIDTVGTDQNTVTASCSLTSSFAAAPSFAEDLAAYLLERIRRDNPLFRWHVAGAETIDNIFSEPLIGAPTPAIYHYSGHHHLALDTPDRISKRMLFDMARLTTTYAAFLATAGLNEAIWLAELSADAGERRLADLASESLNGPLADARHPQRRVRPAREQAQRRIESARWLAPERSLLPTPEAYAVDPPMVGDYRLFPREHYDLMVQGLSDRLDRAAADATHRIHKRASLFEPVRSKYPADEHTESRCVPLKGFRGFAAFEDLTDDEREWLRRELGIEMSWGAPMWLQQALFSANGKRTAAEIASLLRNHGVAQLESAFLERVFAFLAERGMVRLRPYLTQRDVRAALEQAGISPGDTTISHFSLSRFGYIEGGADALIDTLLDLLGTAGTLMMPTFTFSWVGHPPYERATTSSRVGAVTDRFWRRPGVQRSAHPTHSFAAIGPNAERLLAGHDHTRPPLGEESPLARLVALDGKIIMFSPLGSNSSMHLGEVRGGMPLPDFLCHFMEDGRRREVIVPRCPWHARFEPAYERLGARDQLRSAPLGEGDIYVMRCRDVVEAHETVVRETPELSLQPGCECVACRMLRERCVALGRPV